MSRTESYDIDSGPNIGVRRRMEARPTDEQITEWSHRVDNCGRASREVLASRKLIADLRALHVAGDDPAPGFVLTFCCGCDDTYPCPTIRLIEEAGL